MNKGNKVFWMIISILFAIGAIAVGQVYEAKRRKEMDVAISKSIASTEMYKVSPTQESTQEKKEEGSTNKTDASSDEANDSEKKSTVDGQNAQRLIDGIIINNQVRGDFTLDDYQAAKKAVDALPTGDEKEMLQKQIDQIETALKNMGISY